MCEPEGPTEPNPFDPDEEPTKPMPPKTTAEIAAEWQAEFGVPSSERPTKKIKRLSLPSSNGT